MTRKAAIRASRVPPAMAAMALALCLTDTPARAGCAGVAALDTCLVGAWKQTGGGPVEWMRRNMPPGMSIPRAQQSGNFVVLNGDGTYWTAPMQGGVTIRMENAQGVMQAEGDIKTQANGRWAAAGGKFHLCADRQQFDIQTRFIAPDGSTHTMPLTQPPATGPVAFGYTCKGDALETVQKMPGIGDPMKTQYSRTGAK